MRVHTVLVAFALVWIGLCPRLPAQYADLALPSFVPWTFTNWRVAQGVWSVPENWDNGLPSDWTYNVATIDNGGVAWLTDLEATDCLRIGCNEGTSGTLQVLAGGDITSAAVIVGSHGTGSLAQADGRIVIQQRITVDQHGQTGTYGGGMIVGSTQSGYLLSGTGRLRVDRSLCIGWYDDGSFLQSGGVNETKMLFLGHGQTCQGTYCQTAGSLTVEEGTYIGHEGSGLFTQSGGTHQTGKLYLGYNGGDSGEYVLENGATLTADYSTIAVRGTGIFVSFRQSCKIGIRGRKAAVHGKSSGGMT